MGLALAVLLAGGVTVACSDTSSGGSEQPGELPEALGDRVWVLDPATSTPTIAGEGTVTMTFESGRVSGQAPCNSYNAEFTIDGDQLELGSIATTRMACDPATSEAETTYLEALGQVDRVAVDGDRVTLSGDNDVELIFDVQDLAANLVGTWEITSLADGDALTSPLPGSTPTIDFASDGSLTANAGCNQVVSTWELDGASLSIGEGQRTLMACADPEGVMEQEDALAGALEKAARVELADHLTIYDGEDTILIVATHNLEG